MLTATPLVSLERVEISFLGEGTHKLPMKKIADTPTFRLIGICNLHMQINGNSSIKESDMRLKTAVTTIKDLKSRQLPGTSVSQILALGVH